MKEAPITPELCSDCKDVTFLVDGVRHDVIITPGNRYESGSAHTCKVCVNCGDKYANRDAHRELMDHWPDERVKCWHLFHHCTTWEEKKAVQERIDYARRVGDVGMLPTLLENLKWCPSLGGVPPKPTTMKESE